MTFHCLHYRTFYKGFDTYEYEINHHLFTTKYSSSIDESISSYRYENYIKRVKNIFNVFHFSIFSKQNEIGYIPYFKITVSCR